MRAVQRHYKITSELWPTSWSAFPATLSYMSGAVLFIPFLFALVVYVQSGTPPSSWPQIYPGIPTGDYGPEWQNCG